jgi:hypothetical protein
MISRQLTLGSLLATAPLFALAQAVGPAPTPRYYVGLAAYSSAYQGLEGNAFRGGPRIPVQVAAGYQLRPRLAVQLGVAYSGVSYSTFGISRYFITQGAPAGVYFDYSSQRKERNTSVALLARYTLTRQPAHRLQVDVLGGATMEVEHYAYSSVNTDSLRVPVTSRYAENGTNWAYLVTAGPSVRYRFGRHLEALLDFTLSYDFDRSHRPYSSLLTGATALGLRYRFGGLR